MQLPLFLQSNYIYMSNAVDTNKEKDFGYNWVTSSRFLFYIQVFIVFAMVLGGCFNLYQHRYKGKPEVEVPGNTLYTPVYK